MANNRDEFVAKTKFQLGKRAGWCCSAPHCRKPTEGSTEDGTGELSKGHAAHIVAAAPKGPRKDTGLTPAERRSFENGIWLCRDCGVIVDGDEKHFTSDMLREWKRDAMKASFRRVAYGEVSPPAMPTAPELRARLRASAKNDLVVFRRTAKWPLSSVSLVLQVEEFDQAVTTAALARVVRSLDDLILIAPPGLGKTAALCQISEGILASEDGVPLLIPLGDWAADNLPLLDSILRRAAFATISEAEFRASAAEPGIILLLDGWNELDGAARERARVQIERLKGELPELGLVIASRKQLLDVPFTGTLAELLPLNDEQQVAIAGEIGGDSARALLDQAWRTPGVAELISTPLYLTALLSLPAGSVFPTTKEEILRTFVSVQETDPRRAEALRSLTQCLQGDYLNGLGVAATKIGNTTLTDAEARRSISSTAGWLFEDGQIGTRPDPTAVISALVDNHLITRSADGAGISFQHQQFQEWYASHAAERLLISAAVANSFDQIKAEMFNFPVWEESILFAVERMARGTPEQQSACASGILAAFEVDPILAAEMIFRSTDEVRAIVNPKIIPAVIGWHSAGTVDRAVRFMLTSGSPEFLAIVWPLLTHENDQVSLKAIRNCSRFRTSVLGSKPIEAILALPTKQRRTLLSEIAYRGGIDGLDLATRVAVGDPDSEVKTAVIESLMFRRAERHAVEILKSADDAVLDRLVSRDYLEEISDPDIRARLDAAVVRTDTNLPPLEQLRRVAFTNDGVDRGAELARLVEKIEIKDRQDAAVSMIYHSRSRYPEAVSAGLLERVRNGADLFYGADDILAASRLISEDEPFLAAALVEDRSERGDAAASVLGPISVARLLDELHERRGQLRDSEGRYDQAASDRYHHLKSRIAHVPGTSLVEAVQLRSAAASEQQICDMAGSLASHTQDHGDRSRPFSATDIEAIADLVLDWGSRLLANGASRSSLAEIARLAATVPHTTYVPLLKLMSDENLTRLRAFRDQAKADGWSHSPAVDEARTPMCHEYQRAFAAIKTPESYSVLVGYLSDPDMSDLAADVLKNWWTEANEPPLADRFSGELDFARIREKRAAVASSPGSTTEEAEAIFGQIDALLSTGEEEPRNTALRLVIPGVRLPHGSRAPLVEALIGFTPRRARAKLLLSLGMGGAVLPLASVAQGIAETIEVAKKEPWILTQSDAYELRDWLRLLPLTDGVDQIPAIYAELPTAQQRPSLWEEMLSGLAALPSEIAEATFFKLGEMNPQFLQNHRWQSTAFKFETESAALRLLNLIVAGGFSKGGDDWHWAKSLGEVLIDFPSIRSRAYEGLKSVAGRVPILVGAIEERPDEEGIVLLLDLHARGLNGPPGWRAIENVVTHHEAVQGTAGAYHILPTSAASLRQTLLAMVTDGGSADMAARCLTIIDSLRDQWGVPSTDPRHPDLASGKAWPIMRPDPEATPD